MTKLTAAGGGGFGVPLSRRRSRAWRFPQAVTPSFYRRTAQPEENTVAGDWIAIRTDLHDTPEVIQLSTLLKLDEDTVVGKLVRFWSWADRHADVTDEATQASRSRHAASVTHLRAARIKGVTRDWIDRFVGHEGFADALHKVGWAVFQSDGLVLPEFERWNTQSGRQRLLAARRAAAYRARTCKLGASRARNAASVTEALPTGQDNIEPPTPKPPTPPKGGQGASSSRKRKGAAKQSDEVLARIAREDAELEKAKKRRDAL